MEIGHVMRGLDIGGLPPTLYRKLKAILRNLLEQQVHGLGTAAAQNACGEFLFGEGRDARVRVGSEYQFEFHPDAYAPTRDDRGE